MALLVIMLGTLPICICASLLGIKRERNSPQVKVMVKNLLKKSHKWDRGGLELTTFWLAGRHFFFWLLECRILEFWNFRILEVWTQFIWYNPMSILLFIHFHSNGKIRHCNADTRLTPDLFLWDHLKTLTCFVFLLQSLMSWAFL
jgi:hypothetical protein